MNPKGSPLFIFRHYATFSKLFSKKNFKTIFKLYSVPSRETVIFQSYRAWKAHFGCLESVFKAFHEYVLSIFRKLCASWALDIVPTLDVPVLFKFQCQNAGASSGFKDFFPNETIKSQTGTLVWIKKTFSKTCTVPKKHWHPCNSKKVKFKTRWSSLDFRWSTRFFWSLRADWNFSKKTRRKATSRPEILSLYYKKEPKKSVKDKNHNT